MLTFISASPNNAFLPLLDVSVLVLTSHQERFGTEPGKKILISFSWSLSLIQPPDLPQLCEPVFLKLSQAGRHIALGDPLKPRRWVPSQEFLMQEVWGGWRTRFCISTKLQGAVSPAPQTVMRDPVSGVRQAQVKTSQLPSFTSRMSDTPQPTPQPLSRSRNH